MKKECRHNEIMKLAEALYPHPRFDHSRIPGPGDPYCDILKLLMEDDTIVGGIVMGIVKNSTGEMVPGCSCWKCGESICFYCNYYNQTVIE